MRKLISIFGFLVCAATACAQVQGLGTAWTAVNRIGDLSNMEVECYTPAQVAVTNGNLDITVARKAATCGDTNLDGSAGVPPTPENYSSGDVMWNTFNYLYGTLEVRAKMAGGVGPWPAIWMLGTSCQAAAILSAGAAGGPCNWPQPGSDEIDFVEILNGDHTHVNQGIHTGTHNDNCSAPSADVSAAFHVYQLVWAPGSLIWKIDGNTTCTIAQSYVPSSNMFLMINIAMGGAGGSIADTTLPQTTSVDYVKLTQNSQVVFFDDFINRPKGQLVGE